MDVRGLMRRSAVFHADRDAVIHGAGRLTFAQAWSRGVQLANGLLALGLRPGDRVGVLEDNCLSAADAFIGLGAANLVRVPLYPRNSRPAHAHMLGHTGCRALLVTPAYAGAVAGLADEVAGLEHVIVRDDGYQTWLAAQSTVDPDPPISPDDWYVIRHTAGTTGLPKGVAYSHHAWLAAGRDWFYAWPPVEVGDRCLHVGPISHASGYFFVPTWLSGGTNVMMDHFDAGECLDVMERERIGYLFAAPTMVADLARHPGAGDRDWSALKVLNVGGAPISDDTARLAHAVFGDALWQVYGQTEAVPVTMMSAKEWFSAVEGSNPLRSAGRPLPFAALEVVDEDGRFLPLGEIGEIALCCDGQMVGFWEDETATKERLVDNWVLTGDMGRVDTNGYLYIMDRKHDMIVSGGFNIWPAELENAIAEHPAVLEAAVFAVPDDHWGETPLAVCSIAGGAAVTDGEIIALCRDRLGSYKKPSTVVFTTDPLPRTPVGKLDRKALREPYWAGIERRVGGG
ncbi:MAG TPA: AMP-binding protein [Acidimicrobiia bacterium]|nr:AMP-binding protein [Acidimicrobiia bacterium]